MKFHAIGIALPMAVAVASCVSGQKHYDGAIIPIHSLPLAQPTAPVAAMLMAASTGRACRRRGRTLLLHRPVSTASMQHYRYPDVLTDPVTHGTNSARSFQAATMTFVTSGVAGKWNVTGTATSCTVRLSSQGLLDVKRASVSGCKGSVVEKVKSWRSKGKTIELLEPGGHVPAKFEANIMGGFNSSMTDYGGSLQLSR